MLKENHRQKRAPSSRVFIRLVLSEESSAAAVVVALVWRRWEEWWRGVKEMNLEEVRGVHDLKEERKVLLDLKMER